VRSTFRPSNSAWTPVQSPLRAVEAERTGGSNPGVYQHSLPLYRLAGLLSKRQGWAASNAVDRRRLMRDSGMSDAHAAEWGEDTWVRANALRNRMRM